MVERGTFLQKLLMRIQKQKTSYHFFKNINTATKAISIGMSCNVFQRGIDGTENLARVYLKGYEAAPFGTTMSFELQNFTTNDTHGNPISLTVEGSDPLITGVEEEPEVTGAVPESFKLSQNYHNPFNPEKRISYEVSKQTIVNRRSYEEKNNNLVQLFNYVDSDDYCISSDFSTGPGSCI